MRANEAPADFLTAYRETLEAAAEGIDTAARTALLAIVRAAFGPDG